MMVQKPCGKFSHDADPTDNTRPGIDTHTCWMGYVLYYTYFHQEPNSYPLPPTSYNFVCKDKKSDISYPGRLHPYGMAVAFPDHNQYPTSLSAVQEMFTLKDPTFDPSDDATATFNPTGSSLCNLTEKMTDKKSLYDKSVGADQHLCWNIKEFAMKRDKIKDILGADPHDSFISNPSRLVVIAVGCNERQTKSAGCVDTDPYTWLRMASDTKILTICSDQPCPSTGPNPGGCPPCT